MRAAVVGLAENLGKSASRMRKVFQSGSLDVGCGIVIPVSAVDWDAFSADEAESPDEEACDEFRGIEEPTLLREALYSAGTAAAKLDSFVAVGIEDEAGMAVGLMAGKAALPDATGSACFSNTATDREGDDAPLEKTL